MSAHEDLALQRLALELLTSFPQAAAADVDLLLAHLHQKFSDAPIREFVPVLIRRAARDHLAGRGEFSPVVVLDVNVALPAISPHLVA